LDASNLNVTHGLHPARYVLGLLVTALALARPLWRKNRAERAVSSRPRQRQTKERADRATAPSGWAATVSR